MNNQERALKLKQLYQDIYDANKKLHDFITDQVAEWQEKNPGKTLELRDDEDSYPMVDIEGYQVGFDEVKWAPVFTDFTDAPDENFAYDYELKFKVCEGGDFCEDGTWMGVSDFSYDEWEYLIERIKFED